MNKTLVRTKAIKKATEDFESNKEANSGSSDSAFSTIYYETYYKLRTEKNLAHIIKKYGPI